MTGDAQFAQTIRKLIPGSFSGSYKGAQPVVRALLDAGPVANETPFSGAVPDFAFLVSARLGTDRIAFIEDGDGTWPTGGISGPTWIWSPGGDGAYMTGGALPDDDHYPGLMAWDGDRVICLSGNVNDDFTVAPRMKTWGFDASTDTWADITTGHEPTTFRGSAAAYDVTNDCVIFFGGWVELVAGLNNAHVDASDTWKWTGSDWAQLSPANAPTARYGHSLAWDGSNLILFGGAHYPHAGSSVDYQETWKWTGADWTQLAPATTPPKRWGHSMIFDGSTGIIMHGGSRFTNTSGAVTSADASSLTNWHWNGTDWSSVTAGNAGPGSNFGYRTSQYDGSYPVTTTGFVDVDPLHETWRWTGTDWQQWSAGSGFA